MIEYFRLKIEDLRSAFDLRPVGRQRVNAPEDRSIEKGSIKNDRATRGVSACAARAISTNIQSSIVNRQFRPVRIRNKYA